MDITMTTIEQIGQILTRIRAQKPLIHHITNYVTVNDCANVTLAIGASPIMADDIEEAADIAGAACALVLNMGTLNSRTVDSMLAAGRAANQNGVPVILDPVGAGASTLRSRTAEQLLREVRFAVIRGNLSELRYLAGENASAKGVDVADSDLQSGADVGIPTAKAVAQRYRTVAAITGATDIVTDGARTLLLNNGHPMLSAVTGTGCMTTSLVASFCGASNDYVLAAAGGILSMGLAGEQAYQRAGDRGTGSFHIAVIDALSRLNAAALIKGAKLHEA